MDDIRLPEFVKVRVEICRYFGIEVNDIQYDPVSLQAKMVLTLPPMPVEVELHTDAFSGISDQIKNSEPAKFVDFKVSPPLTAEKAYKAFKRAYEG